MTKLGGSPTHASAAADVIDNDAAAGANSPNKLFNLGTSNVEDITELTTIELEEKVMGGDNLQALSGNAIPKARAGSRLNLAGFFFY